MVTSNVIQRTFKIRRSNSQGSAFTVDRGGKQSSPQLVTWSKASGPVNASLSCTRTNGRPSMLPSSASGEGEVDVVVLACLERLSPSHPLEPDDTGFAYGQQAYFLGFPFGWDSGGEHINNGLPLPFVKAGVISAFTVDGSIRKIYIDAHVNKGFSGGPLVFSPPGHQHAFQVAGVVVGYPKQFQPVVDDRGNQVAHAQENPGLVLAIGIRHVVALIDANPIGFVL